MKAVLVIFWLAAGSLSEWEDKTNVVRTEVVAAFSSMWLCEEANYRVLRRVFQERTGEQLVFLEAYHDSMPNYLGWRCMIK